MKIAAMLASLQSFGRVPVTWDCVKRACSMGAISAAASLRILTGMLSGPFAFLGFSLLRSFLNAIGVECHIRHQAQPPPEWLATVLAQPFLQLPLEWPLLYSHCWAILTVGSPTSSPHSDGSLLHLMCLATILAPTAPTLLYYDCSDTHILQPFCMEYCELKMGHKRKDRLHEEAELSYIILSHMGNFLAQV